MPMPSQEFPDRFFTVGEIFCLIYLVSKLLCTAFSLPESEEFAVKVVVISVTVYIFFGLFACLFFYVGGKKFLGLLDDLDDINQRIIDFGHHENFLKQYKVSGGRIQKFADFMAVISCVCATFFATSTPIIDYLHGNYGQNPWAIKAQCKTAQAIDKIRWMFEVIVIEEIMNYLVPGTHKFVTDCIMISLLKIQSLHFSYLSQVLQNVSMKTDKSENTKFLIWLKIHQDAVQNFNKLVLFFSPILVVYSMGIITMIAGLLIFLVQAESPNVFQTIFGSTYMCLSMLQLFLLGNATDEVKNVSESIAFDVYSIPWYEMAAKDRDYVRLVINVANYRVYVEAYKTPAFRMDRETYLKIFGSTVSAYIGLKKLIEMKDAGLGAE